MTRRSIQVPVVPRGPVSLPVIPVSLSAGTGPLTAGGARSCHRVMTDDTPGPPPRRGADAPRHICMASGRGGGGQSSKGASVSTDAGRGAPSCPRRAKQLTATTTGSLFQAMEYVC